MDPFLLALREMSYGSLLGVNGWLVAVIYIVGVYALAQVLKWGKFTIGYGRFLVPGGAMAISPPLMELAFSVLLLGVPSAPVLALAALHFLRVRLVLFAVSWILIVVLRLFGNDINLVACIDGRFIEQLERMSGCYCLHTGVCGAFVSLSFLGTVPFAALFGLLAFAGVEIPLWLQTLSLFPVLLLLGKIIHIQVVGYIADVLNLSEVLWALPVSVLTGRPIQILSPLQDSHR